MDKAIESAAKAICKQYRYEPHHWRIYSELAKVTVNAYLSALSEDDAVVEKVARALCSDPDQIIYWRTGLDSFEELGPRWKVEHAEDARAALSALKTEVKP